MSVALVLDQMTLPPTGMVKLQLDYTFDLKISAETARRQAQAWFVGEVSYMIRAGEPALVIGQAATGAPIALWRVPAILTATHLGDVGEAGYIDIAVESGEMLDPEQRAAEILNGAGNLAASMPPYTPRSDTPTAFLAMHLKPTIAAPTGNPRAILQIAK
jgi:hypothetical protein